MSIDLAIIGGSGVYELPGLAVAERRSVTTPFGAPSDAIAIGTLGERRVAFLARHGSGHKHAPHRINYRANIWALREIGTVSALGINACGGITPAYGPEVLAVPHQLIDYTCGRPSSFCDRDDATEVVHIDFSDPYSEPLRQRVIAAAAGAGVPLVPRGVVAVTQGPRLETTAEIKRLARDGCDLVGMTAMPEAALAREAGLEFASIALVANWAAGCDARGVGQNLPPISIEQIFSHIRAATAQLQRLLAALSSH